MVQNRLPSNLRPGLPLNGQLPPMSLAVVGVAYANDDASKSNRLFEIKLCKPGDPVELRPEPKNKHDPSAVAVFSERGVQIGYVMAERCGRIGALIREGREVLAIFQDEAQFGAWIRVAFDGEEPVLPVQSSAATSSGTQSRRSDPEDDLYVDPLPDQDFYPDEDWPD